VIDTWNIRFITEWDEIYDPEFQSKWHYWADNAANSHVFFQPALCMAWIETYLPLRKLHPLFCLAESEAGTLFLPLVIWHRSWKNAFQKVIVSVGYSDFDYHEPYFIGNSDISQRGEVYKYVIDEIKKRFTFDTIEINGILTEVTGNGWSKEEQVSPFCDLAGFNSIEEYLQSLKTSLRGDIRRQLRRIAETSPLDLIEFNNLSGALEVLPRFLELHKKRWPKAYKAPEFHANLLKHGLEAGIVHFSALKAGGETLSYHLGFKFAGIYYYYMPAIDPRFENLSPGKIHLFMLVDYAINNHFKVFDHLRGDENYKSGWADTLRPLYKFSLQSDRGISKCRNRLVSLKKVLFESTYYYTLPSPGRY
jgi:hypothetical protein